MLPYFFSTIRKTPLGNSSRFQNGVPADIKKGFAIALGPQFQVRKGKKNGGKELLPVEPFPD
jgi:hypothetical protein